MGHEETFYKMSGETFVCKTIVFMYAGLGGRHEIDVTYLQPDHCVL
jgi:hypothetical protein